MGQIVNNSVPACGSCNQRKGNKRVLDCCDSCANCWVLYGPPEWAVTVPTITLAEVTLVSRLEAV